MKHESIECQVAILAGGAGTRLKTRTGDLPKPMAPILGRPVLEHQIALCRRHGFTRVALLVHYAHEIVREHFGSGERFGVELRYFVEQEARGTAGALRDALPGMAERFIVLYADTYADVDLRSLWRRHVASGCAATLLLHPNDHPQDSDLVEVDAHSRVVAVHGCPHAKGHAHANLVNAALYVMERAGLEEVLPAAGRADLGKHTFPAMLAQGLALHGVVSPEYIKDMGTPERLDKVERDILAGLPERLSSRHPRAAVFLDRDGTLNAEVGHLRTPEQLRLIAGSGAAVRALNRGGWLAVGITNQPVVARGEVTWEGLGGIHAALDQLLGEEGAYLDRMYVCPHHPDRGYPGEVPELKIACDCRKPAAGLLDRAVQELDIDRRRSWMVGDTTADILAGQRAGVRTILLGTGHGGQDGKHAVVPDYVMPDLLAAVDWILHGHARMARRLAGLATRAADARLVLVGGPALVARSSAARVFAELLEAGGRTAHVVCLDGWLHPDGQRHPVDIEGALARHDAEGVRRAFDPLLEATGRQLLEVPIHDRTTHALLPGRPLSVGEGDVLIAEGVTALLDDFLVARAPVRLSIDVEGTLGGARPDGEFAWRGEAFASSSARIALGELDELDEATPLRGAAAHATDRIEGS